MTGLRQGELLALRWRDVDWKAARIRVRQNHVRGHWGTPKTRRGSRSVPLADRVAGELDRHFKRSRYQADDDLVFAHPHFGQVLDHSSLVRRYKKALKAAGVREVRFNDLRHTFGTRMAAAGGPDADAPGVDGPPRHQDHADLRGLRPQRARERARRGCFLSGDDELALGRAPGSRVGRLVLKAVDEVRVERFGELAHGREAEAMLAALEPRNG